ncbi:RNA polymerase sigma factor [Microlunatus ginsengisoli]|uniref:RNA polymerase sigma factor n=1 Tax=Microlunatus ginsengisoli TaxID=363863 RepID=UPI0031CF89CB
MDVRARLETVWRMEYARIVAVLARLLGGDVGRAEEIAQDTMVVALEQWSRDGIPRDPAPWLMATAKHRAVDAVRRRTTYDRKLREVAETERRRGTSAGANEPDPDEFDQPITDDLLRLVFTATHPVLPPTSRTALTLKVLAGLRIDEIARAFLISESTAAQRIVRAKRILAEQQIRLELPPPDQRRGRLAAVLEVIYLIFNEGYAATAGENWTRPDLCAEAVRLGRLLAGLMPGEPEVHGLLALMELQSSRLAARIGPVGEAALLPDQDRTRWDRLLIRLGLAALDRVESLGGGLLPYTLQARIAACHARARHAEDTDWGRIAALYTVLGHVAPSPVVELNRAVAVGMVDGPAAALALLDRLAGERAIAGNPQLPAARGEQLARLGRAGEAADAFAAAARLSRNAREREVFSRRARTPPV